MKTILLAITMVFGLGGTAYAATCCGGPCCEAGAPCCED